MLKYSSVALVLAVTGLAFTGSSASAQIDRDRLRPAEVPPESYTGNQYVDSRGCVYVRAGVDGAVRWVPRVARNRQVICGFQPSLAQGGGAPASTEARSGDSEVVQIVPGTRPADPEPAPAETVAAPARSQTQERAQTPQPTQTVQSRPAATTAQAAPVRRVPVQRTTTTERRAAPAATVAPAPARQTPTVTARRVQPAPAPAPVQSARNGRCVGASEVSNLYKAQGKNVRCGPQQQPFAFIKGQRQQVREDNGTVRTIRTRGAEVYSGTSGITQLSGSTTIAPKAAYEERKGTVVKVPPGYKQAWEDDRLNPKRAHQTVDGRRKMLLTWTNEVPRRLVDKLTGEEVSRFFPDLQYPYISPRQQAEAAARQQANVATKSSVNPVRGRPASHRFVQAGVFRSDQAQSAILRMQRAGLPVKISEFTRDGTAYRIVLAGPYAEQAPLEAGLRRVIDLGYTGAKLRK